MQNVATQKGSGDVLFVNPKVQQPRTPFAARKEIRRKSVLTASDFTPAFAAGYLIGLIMPIRQGKSSLAAC